MTQLKATAKRVIPPRLWSYLRRYYLALWGASFRNRLVSHSYGGHELTLELTDALSEGWYDTCWSPLPEIQEMKARGCLGPGSTVFDLGAHQGVVALMFAREVGEGGRVIAVEAEARNARAAERNRSLNQAENLEILHAAAGAEIGTVRFENSFNGHVTQIGGVEVPSITVDELARRHGSPDVVLIDVEGFELHVLRGARETIDARATAFVVEVHGEDTRVGGVSEIVSLLDGYDLRQAPGAPQDSQDYSFESFVPGERADRFFLLAVPRS